MLRQVICEMEKLFPGQLSLAELMKNHTTWRIGGPADIFVEPDGIQSLVQLVAYAGSRGLPLTVIGNGSNLLVRDGGIRGLVVKIGRGLSEISVRGTTLIAEAGARLSRLAATAYHSGIGGFEFIAGIPGTVGGAVVMNAGAYGKSISQVVEEVVVMDRRGEIKVYPSDELTFGYRTSSLQGSSLIVLRAVFRGICRDPEYILKDMEDYLNRRKATQPLEYPSAGSVFKNPPGQAAGRLIEEAGGKGMREGDAQVSTKHANFIVNLGGATARDVLALITRLQELVYNRFRIELPLEVQILGED